MKLESKALMGEYYRREREKYPDLTFAQFEEAIRGPWKAVRAGMGSGTLDSYRLRYLGIFSVYRGRARYMLDTLPGKLERGVIDREQHDRLRVMLESYFAADPDAEKEDT